MIRALVCEESVTIPACEPVSEIAVVAHVVDRHRAQRAGDPLAGREQHVHLALERARRRSRRPAATSSSVVLPRAESTATTCLPPSRAATIRARGALDVLGLGDRGAAELHHHRLSHRAAENTIAAEDGATPGARRGRRSRAGGRSPWPSIAAVAIAALVARSSAATAATRRGTSAEPRSRPETVGDASPR